MKSNNDTEENQQKRKYQQKWNQHRKRGVAATSGESGENGAAIIRINLA